MWWLCLQLRRERWRAGTGHLGNPSMVPRVCLSVAFVSYLPSEVEGKRL